MKNVSLLIFLFLSLPHLVFAFSINQSCAVIEYNTRCVAGKNRCTVERSILIEIMNRSAEKYTKISIPYSKMNRVTILTARIEDTNGNVVRELKKSDFSDRNALSGVAFYADNFVRTFELKHNVYPYRIRYAWKYDYEEFFSIVDWRPYLDVEIPTLKARLEVQLPLDYPVIIHKQHIEKVKSDTIETKVLHTFEVSDVVLPKSEIYSIGTEKLASVVEIVPVYFKWAVEGNFSSWKDFGDWVNALNMDSDDLPDSEKQKVRALTGNITDKRKIIDVVYKYLQQNTRYVSVDIGFGGLKPYPASYVAANRYGDCKALSVYMKSLLDVAGIRSCYVLVYAGGRHRDILKSIVSPQFNHAILMVPLETDTIFVDCTAQNVPSGYMGTFTQGREVLVVKSDSSYFKMIPALKSSEVKEESIHDYKLSLNGCEVNMKNTYRGYMFDFLKSIQMNLNYNESEEYLRERFFNFPSFELKNWKLNQPHTDSTFAELNATLQLNNFLKPFGNEMGFPIYPLAIPNYEKPADRKLPLLFEYPELVEDRFTYHLEAPLQPKIVPENISIVSHFGSYTLKTVVNGNTITVNRCFELFRGEYSLEEYQQFYTFIQKIVKNNKLTILLTK